MRAGRITVLAALAAAVAVASFPATGDAGPRRLTLLQANVGNVNVNCQREVFKLCLVAVERRATERIAQLRPDLVTFQEILPVAVCEALAPPETSPFNLCAGFRAREPVAQVRRLLGPRYSIACDERFAWDCIAVRTPAGSIEGCDRGDLCLHGAPTRPVQGSCEDAGFTLSVATVRLRGGRRLTLANGHPSSTDDECRRDQIRDLLEAGVPARGPTIVSGDFNLDPFRDEGLSVRYWETQVPRRFSYLSGPREHDPPFFTSVPGQPSQVDPTGELRDGDVQDLRVTAGPLAPRTIDHVVARGLRGWCSTLGEAPGTLRLDGGGGMDHRALICTLRLGR